jgi:hypothetical protein
VRSDEQNADIRSQNMRRYPHGYPQNVCAGEHRVMDQPISFLSANLSKSQLAMIAVKMLKPLQEVPA